MESRTTTLAHDQAKKKGVKEAKTQNRETEKPYINCGEVLFQKKKKKKKNLMYEGLRHVSTIVASACLFSLVLPGGLTDSQLASTK